MGSASFLSFDARCILTKKITAPNTKTREEAEDSGLKKPISPYNIKSLWSERCSRPLLGGKLQH